MSRISYRSEYYFSALLKTMQKIDFLQSRVKHLTTHLQNTAGVFTEKL